MQNNLIFKKATLDDKDTIFSWLDEPHVIEFWDNSQAHRDDILNFMMGRQQPSPYFDGIFDYWLGYINEEAFCFLLTSPVTATQDIPQLYKQHLPADGNAYGIDFCIGNTSCLGKGLAASTLQAFMQYFVAKVDTNTCRFFIDPDAHNPRAIHVYAQAGFEKVGEFIMPGGVFAGEKSVLMAYDIS